MLCKANYDLRKTTLNILKILKRHYINAVFNTCGKILEVYPNIIKKINREGHEIAFHGYMHEDFNKISIKELLKLIKQSSYNDEKNLHGFSEKI